MNDTVSETVSGDTLVLISAGCGTNDLLSLLARKTDEQASKLLSEPSHREWDRKRKTKSFFMVEGGIEVCVADYGKMVWIEFLILSVLPASGYQYCTHWLSPASLSIVQFR